MSFISARGAVRATTRRGPGVAAYTPRSSYTCIRSLVKTIFLMHWTDLALRASARAVGSKHIFFFFGGGNMGLVNGKSQRAMQNGRESRIYVFLHSTQKGACPHLGRILRRYRWSREPLEYAQNL